VQIITSESSSSCCSQVIHENEKERMLKNINNQTSASELNCESVQISSFLSSQLSKNLNTFMTKTVIVFINLTEILTLSSVIVLTSVIAFTSVIAAASIIASSDIIIFTSVITFTFIVISTSEISVSVLKTSDISFTSDSFCALSDQICNFSKEIENSMMCIDLSTSKKYHFMKFSTTVSANNLRELTLVIQECDAVQKVLY